MGTAAEHIVEHSATATRETSSRTSTRQPRTHDARRRRSAHHPRADPSGICRVRRTAAGAAEPAARPGFQATDNDIPIVIFDGPRLQLNVPAHHSTQPACHRISGTQVESAATRETSARRGGDHRSTKRHQDGRGDTVRLAICRQPAAGRHHGIGSHGGPEVLRRRGPASVRSHFRFSKRGTDSLSKSGLM